MCLSATIIPPHLAHSSILQREQVPWEMGGKGERGDRNANSCQASPAGALAPREALGQPRRREHTRLFPDRAIPRCAASLCGSVFRGKSADKDEGRAWKQNPDPEHQGSGTTVLTCQSHFRMSPFPLNFILKDTCSYKIFYVPLNNRGVLLGPDSFQFSWPLTERHDFLASRWRPSRARTLSPHIQAEVHRHQGNGSQWAHRRVGRWPWALEASPLSLLGAGPVADRAPGNHRLQGFCPVINYQRIMSLSCPWPKWNATEFTSVIESNRKSNLLKPLKVSLMLGLSV